MVWPCWGKENQQTSDEEDDQDVDLEDDEAARRDLDSFIIFIFVVDCGTVLIEQDQSSKKEKKQIVRL